MSPSQLGHVLWLFTSQCVAEFVLRPGSSSVGIRLVNGHGEMRGLGGRLNGGAQLPAELRSCFEVEFCAHICGVHYRANKGGSFA